MKTLTKEQIVPIYFDTPFGRVPLDDRHAGFSRPILEEGAINNEVRTHDKERFGRYLGERNDGYIVIVYAADDYRFIGGEWFATFEELLRTWELD